MKHTKGLVMGITGKLETEKPHPPACQKCETDAYLRTDGSKAPVSFMSSEVSLFLRVFLHGFVRTDNWRTEMSGEQAVLFPVPMNSNSENTVI